MLRWRLPRFSVPALLVFALIAPALARPAAADVNSFRAVPSAFSPNGDGQRDVTFLKWNLTGSTADSISISLRKFTALPDSPPLKTFLLLARPVGRDSVAWDGRDDLGALLPDDSYAAHLVARNALGAPTADATIALVIDTVAPGVPVITGPAEVTVADTSFGVVGTAALADTVILFRAGVPVDTVAAVLVDPATYSFVARLEEGDNLLSVQAYDRAFNLSPQTTAILVHYLNTPALGPARALPGTFSPNGDGLLDSTRCAFSIDAPTTRLLVAIRRGAPLADTLGSTSVIVLHDGPAPGGPQSIVWDGRDSLGTIVPDGLYFFRVQAESLSLEGVPIPSLLARNAICTVDNTAPLAPSLVTPLPAKSIRNTIVVEVLAAQTDSLFTWRNGANIARTPTSSLTTVKLSIPLLLGDNDLTFQGRDIAGNFSPIGGPYSVRYETPIGFHANERFGYGDAFVVNLDSPARSVVVDLFTLKGQPVRRLSSNSTLTRYELAWDLNDESGHGVGDGPYLARLTVTYPDGSVQETKAAVVVVK